ncbi:MAG: hypothetical protein WD734_03720 [Dehalococcoidia bacterium]
MADLRIDHGLPHAPDAARVGRDGRRREGRGRGDQRGGSPPPGAEELALAVDGVGRGTLRARFELDAEGGPLVRILDDASGETVALVTPEELRGLAEATGLPSGLLVRLSS